jgi:hypothetical protein
MREKVLAATVAGGLLIGAGFVAAAVSAPGTAAAQEDNTEADNVRPHHRHGAVLQEVLDDLVADGTISQDQADAIADALVAKAEVLKAEKEELRQLIYGFLEDDVITAEELAQLPDDHIFNDPNGPFADAIADGELTRDEIASVVPHPRRDAFRRGARFGALLDDGGIDQSEFDALPDDHPLKQIDVSEYLADGVISIDELREIHQSHEPLGDSA